MGNFLPAIASYIAKGQTRGAILGVEWDIEIEEASSRAYAS